MKVSKLFLSFYLIISFLLSGCATSIGTFPIVSTVKPDYSKISSAPIVKDVTGADSRIWLLCFPLGGAPTIDQAIDDCLKSGHGDFISDARIYDESWTIILFTYGGYEVQGNVGNSQYPPAQPK